MLDEATSGLDATTSLRLVQTLHSMSRSTQKTIVLTIHQPRSEVFSLFDSLLLLGVGGHMIYSGPTDRAMEFLSTAPSVSLRAADYDNPGDFILDVLGMGSKNEEIDEFDGPVQPLVPGQHGTVGSHFLGGGRGVQGVRGSTGGSGRALDEEPNSIEMVSLSMAAGVQKKISKGLSKLISALPENSKAKIMTRSGGGSGINSNTSNSSSRSGGLLALTAQDLSQEESSLLAEVAPPPMARGYSPETDIPENLDVHGDMVGSIDTDHDGYSGYTREQLGASSLSSIMNSSATGSGGLSPDERSAQFTEELNLHFLHSYQYADLVACVESAIERAAATKGARGVPRRSVESALTSSAATGEGGGASREGGGRGRSQNNALLGSGALDSLSSTTTCNRNGAQYSVLHVGDHDDDDNMDGSTRSLGIAEDGIGDCDSSTAVSGTVSVATEGIGMTALTLGKPSPPNPSSLESPTSPPSPKSTSSSLRTVDLQSSSPAGIATVDINRESVEALNLQSSTHLTSPSPSSPTTPPRSRRVQHTLSVMPSVLGLDQRDTEEDLVPRRSSNAGLSQLWVLFARRLQVRREILMQLTEQLTK